MARRAFLATEAMRGQVRAYAARGTPQEDIAKLIGCDAKTLRKHFRKELDLGTAEANAAMCDYLFAAAAAGNVTAQIFWMKTRMGLRERGAAADPTPGTDATSTSQIIILPDNGRDPRAHRDAGKSTGEIFQQKAAAITRVEIQSAEERTSVLIEILCRRPLSILDWEQCHGDILCDSSN